MRIVVEFIVGLVFGLGLVISGMADPAKVLNFLDLFGTWDPSLAFVMGGGVVVTFLGYRYALSQPKPFLAETFHLPTARDVDPTLVAGAACFGVGWGLGGFCPGPAVTAIGLGAQGTLVFVPCMLAGMWIARETKLRLGRIAAGTAH